MSPRNRNRVRHASMAFGGVDRVARVRKWASSSGAKRTTVVAVVAVAVAGYMVVVVIAVGSGTVVAVVEDDALRGGSAGAGNCPAAVVVGTDNAAEAEEPDSVAPEWEEASTDPHRHVLASRTCNTRTWVTSQQAVDP